MSRRQEVFTNNCFYHVFNRTIDARLVFRDLVSCKTFIKTLRYYRSLKADVSLSKLGKLDLESQKQIWQNVSEKSSFQVEILAYCLMPTHFHLILEQLRQNGVTVFLSNVANSFTRNFNLSSERKGPIFLPRFKASHITNEEQLLHVSRYIHLNPYSGGVVSSTEELQIYEWSSFREYHTSVSNSLSSTSRILHLFGNNSKNYSQFVFDNADYQRTLERLKYAEKW